jgi:hypothetical protein
LVDVMPKRRPEYIAFETRRSTEPFGYATSFS